MFYRMLITKECMYYIGLTVFWIAIMILVHLLGFRQTFTKIYEHNYWISILQIAANNILLLWAMYWSRYLHKNIALMVLLNNLLQLGFMIGSSDSSLLMLPIICYAPFEMGTFGYVAVRNALNKPVQIGYASLVMFLSAICEVSVTY